MLYELSERSEFIASNDVILHWFSEIGEVSTIPGYPDYQVLVILGMDLRV